MKLFGEECLNVCGVVASTKTGGLKFPTICLILLNLTINKYRHENKENKMSYKTAKTLQKREDKLDNHTINSGHPQALRALVDFELVIP